MEINKIYYGFKLLNIKEIKEIDSVLYEFKHEKSGASMVYLANDDTNKCFSIGFKTLPEDSTGVCHIIEHSVLCGSKKYPVKEPFVNLLKGSMASFLNAMTASDCTIYPVASQNDKDFDNLMSVYLDAVFAPLSITDPKPFLQEGWHLEMLDEADMPSYKGIVYNEMQGAMSNPLSQLSEYTNQVLYKGSCYEYNSGGDPDVIPELTYDYYKSFYHKHYHPSNGIIYLYGMMDVLEKLEFIDREYLSKFEDSEEKITINLPTPIVDTNVEREYIINDEEEVENNTYISLAFGLEHAKNVKDIMAFSLLNEALLATNASPLKKVLLEKELAEDIESYIDDGSIYPSFGIFLNKTSPDKKELFIKTVFEELKRLKEEGIDRNLLLATININEFKNKELDTGRMPKGLAFAFSIMQGYNYDIPYENYLETSDYYKFFKENLDNGYFESLIEKYILNSNHYVVVTMNPSKELGKIKDEAMKEKMRSLKENMTLEEINECVKITNDLIAYQNRKDDILDVKKLPELKLSDISTKITPIHTMEEDKDGIHYIYHNVNTNKIAYFRAYFDLGVLTAEELAYARILSRLFVRLDTLNYSADALQSHIKTYLGNIGFSPVVNAKNRDEYIAKMLVTVSSLEENISYIPSILNEIINNTIFDLDKIKTILVQMKNRERSAIIENGTSVATTTVRSSLSKEGALTAKMSGINMYNLLSQLVDNFNGDIIVKLENIIKKIFNKNNLIVSLSGDQKTLDLLTEATKELKLEESVLDNELNISYEKLESDALIIPSGVNCNVKGMNLTDLGKELDGSLYVIQHILNYDYLWPEVRVKGGAYGCSLSLSISNDILFGSFSDPNVANTYNVYDSVATYLEEFNPNIDEFNSYLIGTIAKVDPPASIYSKIATSDKNLLCNITLERLEKVKSEILSTDINTVKSYASLFRKIAQQSILFTVGNENKIREFDKIKVVKKLV